MPVISTIGRATETDRAGKVTRGSRATRSRRPVGIEDRRSRPTLWLQGIGGTWHAVGAEGRPGKRPEQLNLTADIAGPATGSFTVRRDPRIPWADMQPLVPAMAEVDGVPVWAGTVQDSPRGDGTITANLRGWQAILDETYLDKWYVHQSWEGWYDAQSKVGTYPVGQRGGNVSMDDKGALAEFQVGTTVATGVYSGVELDLGPGRHAARVRVQVETDAASGWEVYIRGSDEPTAVSTVNLENLYSATHAVAGAGPTYRGGTFSGDDARYVQLFVNTNSPAAPLGLHVWARFKRALVFADAAYESGDASILTAPTVLRDVLASIPELNQDDSLIDPDGAATFVIHHLAPPGYSTARELVQAATSYYRWRVGVDHLRRLFFLPYPTVASYVAGDWPGCDVSGVSPAASAEVYNRVIVEGSTPDGEVLRVVRSAASPILDRLGRTRWGKISVGVPVGANSDLEFIGDQWLAERSRTPLRGELAVTGHALRTVEGQPLHASRTLIGHGRRLRLAHLTNPDTGALGVEGVITNITYDDDGQRAVLTLDDDAKRLDYLLARVGAQVSA